MKVSIDGGLTWNHALLPTLDKDRVCKQVVISVNLYNNRTSPPGSISRIISTVLPVEVIISLII